MGGDLIGTWLGLGLGGFGTKGFGTGLDNNIISGLDKRYQYPVSTKEN